MEPDLSTVYRQAFECAEAGLAVLSPQGEWRLANTALAAMTGQTAQSLCGRRAHETVFDAGIAEGIASLLATPADARPDRVVLESAHEPGNAAEASAWRLSLSPLPDGGLLLQWPLGKLADLYDRRWTMFWVAVSVALFLRSSNTTLS